MKGVWFSVLIVAEGLRPSGCWTALQNVTDLDGLGGRATAGTTQSFRYVNKWDL